MEPRGHFVMITKKEWGHLRPACGLVVRLARLYPDLITSFLVNVDFTNKAQEELTRQCDEDERHSVLARIRNIGVGESMGPIRTMADATTRLFAPDNMLEGLPAAFAALMSDQLYVDGNSVAWEPVGIAPTLLIGDVLMGHIVVPLKQAYKLPLLVWMEGAAVVFLRMAAPAALGGLGQYQEEVEAIYADLDQRKERTLEQVAEDVFSGSKLFPGDIVTVKGLPPHYQWETYPQPCWLPISYPQYVSMISLLHAADGVLLGTVVDLESEAFQGIIDFYACDGKREIIAVGPQLPRHYLKDIHQPVPAIEVDVSTDPCIKFLDSALTTYGPKSALYISFGTIAFPLVPSHIPTLLDVLLHLDPPMPFVITVPGSVLAPLPPGIRESVHSTGRGLIVDWAPQQALLTHPALGWVLSHCGGNTIFECLARGVPLIAWPLFGDQPVHALWLAEVLGVAFELVQTRVGRGAKRAYRGGLAGTEIVQTDEALKEEIEDVLGRCRGREGKKVRRNAERARDIILTAVAEGGQVEQHLKRLAKYL